MEKIDACDIKSKSNFLKFLDNFWYHYKFHTIAVLFLLFVVIICSVQMCSNDNKKQDTVLLCAGTAEISGTRLEGLRGAFNAVIPYDYNGDGVKFAEIFSYQIYSEDKLKAILAEGTEEAHDAYMYYKNISSSEYDTYKNMIATGEVSVCFVDPYLYEKLKSGGLVSSISDALGYKPGTIIDDYGIKFSETDFYKYYESVQILPEDTVLCLLKPYIMGASSKKEVYEFSRDMFKSIIEFKQ